MEGFLKKIRELSRFLNMIAGIGLTFVMLLTVADVLLRSFRKPIVGTYELVAFSGAVIIGFSLPFTSSKKGHICVDFFILRFSQGIRKIFHIATRCMGIGLFLIIGWNVIKYGLNVYKSGEVSPTLQIPFFPIAYGVGICCLIQCLVLFSDIIKILGGEYE